MKKFARLQDLAALAGQALAASDWLSVDQSRIDAFAQATGDPQWIHIDAERAAKGPFGTTIAHGFLTLSLLPAMLATAFEIDDVRMGLNYGLNRVRFPAPVPSGSRLRAHFKLLSFESLPDATNAAAQLRLEATIEREGSDKPVCVAEMVVRQFT